MLIQLICKFIFVFFSSPFYKADFCSPNELTDNEDGGIAVVTGRQVSTFKCIHCYCIACVCMYVHVQLLSITIKIV